LIPSDFDAYADGSGVNDASHAERNEDRFYGGWQCGGSMTVANTHDLDPEETREWLDALSSVQGRRGNERAEFVVNAIVDAARGAGLSVQRQRQDRSRARKCFPRRDPRRWNLLLMPSSTRREDGWLMVNLIIRGYHRQAAVEQTSNRCGRQWCRKTGACYPVWQHTQAPGKTNAALMN
jgi:hypothetical protein